MAPKDERCNKRDNITIKEKNIGAKKKDRRGKQMREIQKMNRKPQTEQLILLY